MKTTRRIELSNSVLALIDLQREIAAIRKRAIRDGATPPKPRHLQMRIMRARLAHHFR